MENIFHDPDETDLGLNEADYLSLFSSHISLSQRLLIFFLSQLINCILSSICFQNVISIKKMSIVSSFIVVMVQIL